MKVPFLVLAMAAMTLTATAQKNETVKASKTQQEAREGETFVFPDNIKFSKNELNERVQQKTIDLTKHIKSLATAKTEAAAEREVNETMKLFNNNEYAMVTVTRKSQAEPVTVPVRTYLKRLARLKYDRVNIVWHNAQYVSNFVKQPNGMYMGLVAFEQEFTGMRGGEANYAYHDMTQKRAEVSVKVWDAKDVNPRKDYMDVFLGNIGVTEE